MFAGDIGWLRKCCELPILEQVANMTARSERRMNKKKLRERNSKLMASIVKRVVEFLDRLAVHKADNEAPAAVESAGDDPVDVDWMVTDYEDKKPITDMTLGSAMASNPFPTQIPLAFKAATGFSFREESAETAVAISEIEENGKAMEASLTGSTSPDVPALIEQKVLPSWIVERSENPMGRRAFYESLRKISRCWPCQQKMHGMGD
jgi:hypothetical protein